MTHQKTSCLHKANPAIWILTEGMAGTQNQCIGVAEALHCPYQIKTIALNQPWKALSPYLRLECSATFSPRLTPPWPDILIASGRKSIAAARYIKKKSNGKTFTVQIQDPRISPKNFDLVAVPQHDPTRGDNVLVTTAAPNKITDQKLETEKKRFERLFSALKSPRIAVLIGGKTASHSVAPEKFVEIAEQLKTIAQSASLMITPSRRTGEDNTQYLRNTLKHPNIYFWDEASPNPYMAMLAWADYIIATNDSTSMLSEASTTGKPTFFIPLTPLSKRQGQLLENLKNYGSIRQWHGQLETWNYVPLNDSATIATAIREKSGFFTN